MSKFTERMLFFVFTPLAFIWYMITTVNCSSCTYDSIGDAIGTLSAMILTASIPFVIGMFVRKRRIKKERFVR